MIERCAKNVAGEKNRDKKRQSVKKNPTKEAKTEIGIILRHSLFNPWKFTCAYDLNIRPGLSAYHNLPRSSAFFHFLFRPAKTMGIILPQILNSGFQSALRVIYKGEYKIDLRCE